MNPQITKLHQISTKRSRLIIGLMSGTSVDGLDIALCKIEGAGTSTKVQILNFTTISYHDEYKENIQSIFSKREVDLEKVCLLNAWIGEQHAAMILECLQKWNYQPEQIDLIASHGQTIYHAPKSIHGLDAFSNATLQIGDGDHIAQRTGIITLSDFRQKHIAAGGEGAPLAVYGDYLVFSSSEENRIMLNIGGIANFTYLPKSKAPESVFSTDVGPGNTLMDAYVSTHFPNEDYDVDAALASKGAVNEPLLIALENEPFFQLPFPKTTGPELFNLSYLKQAQGQSHTQGMKHVDVLATLSRFSANSIVKALNTALGPSTYYAIYTSGGGMHNPLLMKNIQDQLPNAVFKPILDLGVDPDAKEALLFALLANETLAGAAADFGQVKAGFPSITMGKISLPN